MSQNNKTNDKVKSIFFAFSITALLLAVMYFSQITVFVPSQKNNKTIDSSAQNANDSIPTIESVDDTQVIFIPEETPKPSLPDSTAQKAKPKEEEKPAEKKEEVKKKEETAKKEEPKKEEKTTQPAKSTDNSTRKITKFVPGTMGQAGKLPSHKCKLKGSINLSFTADKNGNVISVKRVSGLSDECAVSTATSWVKTYVKTDKGTANYTGTYKITF